MKTIYILNWHDDAFRILTLDECDDYVCAGKCHQFESMALAVAAGKTEYDKRIAECAAESESLVTSKARFVERYPVE